MQLHVSVYFSCGFMDRPCFYCFTSLGCAKEANNASRTSRHSERVAPPPDRLPARRVVSSGLTPHLVREWPGRAGLFGSASRERVPTNSAVPSLLAAQP